MPITKEGNDPLKYWGNAEPLCPWCDAKISISDNELFGLYEEGEHEIICPHCEEPVVVVVEAIFKFHTNDQDDFD